ncbi:MAG TPA: DUF2993 domain-containing protein [Streptosporangiaceae bacterium]|jgi:hypothetical protein
MRKLVVTLIVLVLLLVGADFGAKYAAQSAISKQLATSYQLDPAPQVTVHGFPFLTQAISGTYGQIDVDMAEVSRESIRVENVHAHLYDVRAPISEVINNARSITAGRATGTAIVPFDVIKKRLPDGFTVKPSGQNLVLSGKARALGVSVPVKASLKLKVASGGLVATPDKITVAGGQVPGSVVANQIGFEVPIRDLPMHLKITDVQVQDTGVQVTASATNVKFTQS